MKRVHLFLFLILILAAVLRLVWLDRYPAGFTPDEASFGYDAYSILKTGKDQWGESFPLAFRSFGDFKAPLYVYLTIPSVAIFGLNEFAVRLPNALLGVLAVLAVYFLVLELFSKSKNQSPITLRQAQGDAEQGRSITNHQSLALIAALLLAISPWHVSLSRGAFEANLTTFLLPLGVLAFLKGLRSERWMIIAAIVFGLNLFSYHSAKLITPLIIATLVVWKWNSVKSILLHSAGVLHKIAIGIFIMFFSLSVFQFFGGAGIRASDIGIFNPTGGWGAVAERRYEGVKAGLPNTIARVFSNKATYVAGEFTKNYLSYLSPTLLFTQGAGEATYGMIPGHGVLYLFELPFIIAAVWFFVKRPTWSIGFLLIWILLSPIPAALSKGPGSAANRAAVMMPAIQILSAYGAVVLWQIVKNLKPQASSFKRIGLLGYWVIGLLGFLFFLEAYIYHAPRLNAPSMSYGWREAVLYINSIESKYNEVVVSRAFSEPQIFIAFYKKWGPSSYQQQSQAWLEYERRGLLFVDQLGKYKLGKFTFRDLHYPVERTLASTLLVGRKRDFPDDIKVVKQIAFPDGTPAILIVETNNE